ncbi:MAG: DUF2027 domain-containing protein [Rikenellaceae bacterium]
MKIKIGDKVRFLNDVGGGVVVGFNCPTIAIVEQGDGFEIPIHISECVVVEQDQPKSTTKEVKKATNSRSALVTSPKISQSTRVGSDELSIYLVFSPTDSANLEQSTLHFQLINNCSYSLHYTITCRSTTKKLHCRHNGTVRAEEHLTLEELKRTALTDIEYIRIQLIAFKNYIEYKEHPPIDKTLHIRAIRLSKEANFSYSSITGNRAMLIDLTESNATKSTPKIDIQQLSAALNGGSPNAEMKVAPKNKKRVEVTPRVIEVDLHIDTLLDSTKGMDSAAMLSYQKDHIRSTIERYKHNTGLKVIFIHGKGDGILRSIVETELRSAGLGKRYRAASFKRFGSGAIEVNM